MISFIQSPPPRGPLRIGDRVYIEEPTRAKRDEFIAFLARNVAYHQYKPGPKPI